jgi:hypothetical protein
MFYIFAVLGGVWSTHVEIHFASSLAYEGIRPTHVEINFMSSLALDGFVRHKL